MNFKESYILAEFVQIKLMTRGLNIETLSQYQPDIDPKSACVRMFNSKYETFSMSQLCDPISKNCRSPGPHVSTVQTDCFM